MSGKAGGTVSEKSGGAVSSVSHVGGGSIDKQSVESLPASMKSHTFASCNSCDFGK